MSTGYLWDSEAAMQIEAQDLDKHYLAHQQHYQELAKLSWEQLVSAKGTAKYLKPADLWSVLQPTIRLDVRTVKALKDEHLTDGSDATARKWFAWFTHYIVEQSFTLPTKLP